RLDRRRPLLVGEAAGRRRPGHHHEPACDAPGIHHREVRGPPVTTVLPRRPLAVVTGWAVAGFLLVGTVPAAEAVAATADASPAAAQATASATPGADASATGAPESAAQDPAVESMRAQAE